MILYFLSVAFTTKLLVTGCAAGKGSSPLLRGRGIDDSAKKREIVCKLAGRTMPPRPWIAKSHLCRYRLCGVKILTAIQITANTTDKFQ
jgi:hypothetical protein